MVPFTITTINALRDSNKGGNVANEVAPTSELYENEFVRRIAKKRREETLKRKAEGGKSVSRRVAMVVLGWALLLAYMATRETGADIHKFDPFEILGISHSASELEIKKAYKKLSLVHHPDRWAKKDKADRALAETRFIMVAKAYEALTDPIARENFQKYGNPDGRQALEMSIGLPAWLLEKENQGWVIASYLLLCIIVFPASVMLLTSNAAKSGSQPKRLYPDTDELFRVGIRNDARSFLGMAELFSLAAEFRTLTYRSEDEKKLVLELRNQMAREDKFPVKPSAVTLGLFKQSPSLKTSEGNAKSLVLVFAHLNRLHDQLNDELLEDLEYILTRSPIILRSMINHARVTCNVQVLTVAIFFQQHLNQALMPQGTFLLQFPHIPVEDVEYLTSQALQRLKMDKRPEKRARTLLQELFLNSKEGQIAILDDPQQQADLDSVLKQMPFKELKVKLGTIKEVVNETGGKVKDPRDNVYTFEDVSAQGDLVHIVCDLIEQNVGRLASRNKSAIAHTPFLPHAVKEEWYVLVCGGPNPKGFNQIAEGENKVSGFAVLEDDLNERLCADISVLTSNNPNDWMNSADWPIGDSKLTILAFPSAYVDNQRYINATLKLIDGSKLPRFKMHQEDLQLDSEPTSLYAMLQPQADKEIDSDFEDVTDMDQEGEED